MFAKTLSPSHREILNAIEFVGSRATIADLHKHINSQISLPIGLNTDGYDVAVFHDARPFRLSPGTTRVIRYHDAIPLLHPDLLGSGDYTTMHYRLLSEAAKDSWFVCNSESTRRELMMFAPEAHERTVVIPCAQAFDLQTVIPVGDVGPVLLRRASNLMIDHGSEQRDIGRLQALINEWKGSPNYIISIAALEPKKNIGGILAAYECLCTQMQAPPKLVLVGSYGWRCEDTLKEMQPHIRSGNLIHLQNVPSHELMLLLKSAKLCFFPSWAEGFGYPPIEALYAGTPSVVSDLPALKETMGSAAIYVDPNDPRSMCEGLMALLDPVNGPSNRARLLAHRQSVLSHYEPELTSKLWNEFLAVVQPARKKAI